MLTFQWSYALHLNLSFALMYTNQTKTCGCVNAYVPLWKDLFVAMIKMEPDPFTPCLRKLYMSMRERKTSRWPELRFKACKCPKSAPYSSNCYGTTLFLALVTIYCKCLSVINQFYFAITFIQRFLPCDIVSFLL